jgi:hypothetical protein
MGEMRNTYKILVRKLGKTDMETILGGGLGGVDTAYWNEIIHRLKKNKMKENIKITHRFSPKEKNSYLKFADA